MTPFIERRVEPVASVASADSVAREPSIARRIEFPALAPSHGSDPRSVAQPLLRDPHPLHRIRARLDVRVGALRLTVGELLAAREGEVLCLDQGIDDEVELCIDGHCVARGQLVAVGDRFAVRLTEPPLPLDVLPEAQP